MPNAISTLRALAVSSMRMPLLLQDFKVELPPYHRTQAEGTAWLAAAHARAAATAEGSEEALPAWRERMDRLVQRYGCADEHIGRRRSELGDFMHTDWPGMRIFNLHESARGRGLEERSRFFAESVDRVVGALFAEECVPPSDLIHVSCTGYVSPSPIQRLIERRQWHGRTTATQVYHMGCYAAVPALRIAAGFCSRGAPADAARAEIVHTELCTLHFDPGDHSPEQLVVQSLFADGHIRYAAVPAVGRHPRNGASALEVLSLREEIVPGSAQDMTWVLSEWGFRMTLSRAVPEKIAACLPQFLSRLFSDAGLAYESCAGGAIFAVHPGGPRILETVQRLLALDPEQLRLSRAVLFERGNMSSATLPHIWMAAAADTGVRPGAIVVSLAFGPGLTVAGALFRKC